MFKKSRWYLLFIALAVLLLLSIFVVPKIVTGVMNETKGQIITVDEQ